MSNTYTITLTIEADDYQHATDQASSIWKAVGHGMQVSPSPGVPFRVTEFALKPAHVVYTVGYNLIGYLPESEPTEYDNWFDAREAFKDLLTYHAEMHADGCEFMLTPGSGECAECNDFDRIGYALLENPDMVDAIAGNYSYWINREPA